MIGGWTTHDSSPAVLRSILNQWNSDWDDEGDYDDIVNDLVDDWLQPGVHVFDDGIKDKLDGSNETRDLFFADQDGDDGDDDKLTGDKCHWAFQVRVPWAHFKIGWLDFLPHTFGHKNDRVIEIDQ